MHSRTTRMVDKPQSSQRRTIFAFIGTRWGCFLVAAGVTSLLAYYLAWVAPALVPVPPGVKVPYPAATRFLEGVCAWCGQHELVVASIGAALLVPGILSRWSGPRYHMWLAVLLGCALGFSYLSISAPLDRLVERVKSALPEGREIPDYLPGKVRKQQ